MRRLLVIIRKEFGQIRRNPAIIRLVVVMPVIQLLVLPNAADYEIKNILVHVTDQDRSSLSRRLVENIRSSGYFILSGYGSNRPAALEAMENDRADIILAIPHHFEKDLLREGRTTLMVEVNAINGVKAGLGGAYLVNLLRGFNEGIRAEWTGAGETLSGPVRTTHTFRFNPRMEYSFFMVPGILVLLLTMVGMNLTAINIVREKELGTIEQVNVSPIRKHEFILGKLIPQFIMGFVVMTIGFGIARLVYGIVPLGSYLTIYAFAAVYMLAFLGIGMLVSNFSGTMQQAMLVSFFLMMVFILMSGLYTNIDSMPTWAKWVARANPVTWFIEVMRRVVLKGAGMADITRELAVISVYAVLTNALAILSYHKRS